MAEVHDARELLTAALTVYNAGEGLRHPIVRLLGCEQDPNSGQLLVLASSERGLMAAFPVSYPASGSPAGSFTFQPPVYALEGAHKEVTSLGPCSLLCGTRARALRLRSLHEGQPTALVCA